MTVHDDPNDPNRDPRRGGAREVRGVLRDEEARKAARIAQILAAVALLLSVIALIWLAVHDHDFAPSNCDPGTDYVCEPEVVEETGTVDVPTTSLSPTEVPVPTVTPSETVTTTVRP